MRFELRLFAIALFLLVVIAASCQNQAAAEVRRGTDGPWESRGSTRPAEPPRSREKAVALPKGQKRDTRPDLVGRPKFRKV